MWVVTGASGFVGAHVLERLGTTARGLSRAQIGEWTDANLRRALSGARGIVHCASVVHRPGARLAEYVRFNVEGTRALIDAARAVGVGRLVYLSSIKVHGENPGMLIDEHTPVDPAPGYASTKAEAERLILAADDLEPTVLRLCPVYGRGDKGNVRTVIRAIARGTFFVPGDGSTRKSIVHASTVAEVVHALASSDVKGAFVVADRFAPSMRELGDAVAKLLGRRRPRSIPAAPLRIAAEICGRVGRLARIRTRLSGDLIDKAMTDSVCDPRRIERELGVSCSVDLEDALAEEIAWLREQRAL